MDEDLKPCPFCGHEVRVVEKCSWVAGVYTPIYFVQCKKCNCEVDFTEWDETGTPSYKCKYGVITSWNRRAKDSYDIMEKQVTYSLIFACPGIDENGFKMRTFKRLSAAVAAFGKDYDGCIKSELKLQGENLAKLDEGHAYADFGDIILYLRTVEME